MDTMSFQHQQREIGARRLSVASLVPGARGTVALLKRNRTTLAYGALLMFSFLYYARPEDFIPGMSYIPVGKISGGIALLGLLAGWGRRRTKIPLEIKLVLLLFFDLCLTVPFAFWRGGALDVVVNQFSKAAIVALLISMIVNTTDELRRMLWVQAAAVAAMTIASILIHPGGATRLSAVGAAFSNPNDFAVNIAINFPLCLAFLLAAKSILKKAVWLIVLLAMLYAVIATYSRSGFLALVICLLICLWEFGIKGKRPKFLVAAVLLGMVGVGFGLTTRNYTTRLSTLVEGNVRGSMDRGSMDARRELLDQSIELTLQHPLFGVGPGNFQAITESWHVTHNTYTELSSEAGIPALAIFLTIIGLAFRNLRRVRKAPGYKTNSELQLFTGALWAGLAAYLVGAAFSSTAYALFPYFMVAYTSALYRIGFSAESAGSSKPQPSLENSPNVKKPYGKQEQGALA
jgi:O-antigen ligase